MTDINIFILFLSLECFLRAISGKPNKYYNEVAKMEQDCAESTVYDALKCGCDTVAAPAGTLRAPSE